MIDHPDQVKGLEEFEKVAALDPSYESKFKCFVKVNQGGKYVVSSLFSCSLPSRFES